MGGRTDKEGGWGREAGVEGREKGGIWYVWMERRDSGVRLTLSAAECRPGRGTAALLGLVLATYAGDASPTQVGSVDSFSGTQ